MDNETKLICALTEGEISTILYHLQACNSDAPEIERIFEELEGVVDAHYNLMEEFLPNFHD